MTEETVDQSVYLKGIEVLEAELENPLRQDERTQQRLKDALEDLKSKIVE